MAGIGFELKKLFKKESVFSTLLGGIHATAVTIGPTIIVIIALNIMYMLPPYIDMVYQDKEVLSSTILYVFIFSLILASPINILLSRYMADKIYEEEYTTIFTSVETGGLLIGISVAILGIPFGYAMYTVGGLPLYYVFISYLFFAGLAFTFYYMTFITVLKEYGKITYSFLGSLIVGILVTVISVYMFDMKIVDAILLGLAIAFVLIATLLLVFIKKNFRHHSHNFKELFFYIKKDVWLIMANVFYIWGLYIHNFVFWFQSDHRIIVAKVFVSDPSYDMATYLAMLSNISILVIFVVNVETKFHTAYKAYCESIIGAGGKDIRRAKEKMIETLRRETIYIIQIQVIINIIVFLVALVILPKIGIEGLVLTIYPVMSVGYMILYLVQCFMIYLFYLDDARGAAFVGAVFLIGAFLGSLVSVHLPPGLAGLGIVFGAACGFTAAFFRIRYMLIHLDRHIYGRGKIVKQVKTLNKKHDIITVYTFTNQNEGGDSY